MQNVEKATADKEVDDLIENLRIARVRDDISFVDGSHLGEGTMIAHDESQWQYHTLGELDYAILEAVDESDTIEDAIRYLKDEYEVEIDSERIRMVVVIGLKLRLFDLWCYQSQILLSRKRARQFQDFLDAYEEAEPNPALEIFFRTMKEALLKRDAVRVGKLLFTLRDTKYHFAFESLYPKLLVLTFPRARIEINFIQSRLDVFDPRPIYKWMNPLLGWIHGPLAFIPLIACGLFAAQTSLNDIMVILNPSSPGASLLYSPEFAVMAPLSTWTAVFFHELIGHGLALHRFGGRVPTIGFIVFMMVIPGGFANVSDTYLEPKRWKRVWVDAAGLYVNVLMGLTAIGLLKNVPVGTALWAFLCYSVIANFAGIGMNLMPWLKFDGYYIISDALNQPTLYEDANEIGRRAKDWIWYNIPMKLEESGYNKQQIACALSFFVLKTCWILSFIPILLTMMLPRLTSTLGLLGLLLFINILYRRMKPAKRKLKPGEEAPQMQWVHWVRYPRVALVLSVIIVVFYLPLETKVQSNIILQPTEAHDINASTNGQVIKSVAFTGRQVEQDMPLIVFFDPVIESSFIKAATAYEEAKHEYDMFIIGLSDEEKAVQEIRVQKYKQRMNRLYKHEKYLRSIDKGLISQGEILQHQKNRLNVESMLSKSRAYSEQALAGERIESKYQMDAKLKSARLAFEKAKAKRDALVIKAPFKGTIVQSNIREGHWVKEGSPLFTIARLDRLKVMATLSQDTRYARIDLSKPATIRLKTAPKEGYQTKIKGIYSNPDGTIRLEMDDIISQDPRIMAPGVQGIVVVKQQKTSFLGIMVRGFMGILQSARDVI